MDTLGEFSSHARETFQDFLGTDMDVADHDLLTQELRRREAYLAEAQRLSHTGSFGWNVSTDEHYWSDETFRIFEFAPSSKVSLQMILERVHRQDMPSVNMAIAAANSAEGIDLEFRLLMPDERIKYLHVVGKAERDETGGIEVIGAVMDVTARKLTEVELRRSKAHLADAQTLSRTGCVGMEVSTKRIFWSEEAARIYGYPPGTEPTPDLILQRSHPDDVDLLKEVLERAAQGGNDFDWEHRLLMPDGSIKHLHDLAHFCRDETGNEEVVGAIMDITERKVAEEAIRRSEAYLVEAQRLSHTGSFGWNPLTREIVWSDETYRIFECEHSEKPTLEIAFRCVHPDDRAFVQQVIERATNSGTDFELEHRLLMPSGAIKHIHVRAHALHNSPGEVEFIGAVTDITERKTAEEKIREQEAELRQTLDFAPQLIAVFGPSRERLHINRIALDYLGLSLEQWRQTREWVAFVHPDDRARERDYFDRGLSTGSGYELELRLRKGDGSYRWFLARSNPVLDDKGQFTRWYVTCTDIEDRKRAEQTLQQENVALREEIEKASIFEHVRLEERTRIARELHDTLLQSFIGALLHLGAATDSLPPDSQVKSRLNPILQFMEQGIEEGRNAIQGLRSSVSRPSELVAALSAVHQQFWAQPCVDFGVSIVGQQQPLQSAIQDEIYCIGREALINAFCHSGAQRIRVELEYTSSEFIIRVRDNGCGIDPRMLDAGRKGHWGLAGIRERATKISGLLKISSSATDGTEVQLSVPGDVAFPA